MIYIYQFGDLLIGLVIISLLLIRSYTGLQVFSVFYGVGDGIFTTTMNSLLVFSVDEELRAAGLGLANMLLSLGIVAGPPVAGLEAIIIERIYFNTKIQALQCLPRCSLYNMQASITNVEAWERMYLKFPSLSIMLDEKRNSNF